MSDDFTWRPEYSSRPNSMSLRLAVVLFCAGLGVVAGSFYPIKLVVTAFERASQPVQARKENLASSTAQEGNREPLALAPGKPAPASTETKQAAPQTDSRLVLLNPGSAEPARAPQEPPATTERSSPEKNQPVARARNTDRNVAVVVRRRGPPYDTKVLQGRIRDGRLIVNARGLTIR
jgi:hypothetical protein